jgi:amino acid adenylation domain-containing protein
MVAASPTDKPQRMGHPTEDYRPCSREQEGLWLLQETRDIRGANNVPIAARLSGALDVSRLESAIIHLVRAEGALRTELNVEGGRLVRRVRRDAVARPVLERIPARDEAAAFASAAELSEQILEPLAFPPWRFSLISWGEGEHLLLLLLHHCVVDGGSIEPLLARILELYRSDARDARVDGPSQPEFDRFVALERQSLQDGSRAMEYWKREWDFIQGSLRLPTVLSSEPAPVGGRAASLEFAFPAERVARLRSVATNADASLFLLLLAALQVAQHRYAGGGEGGVATAVAMDARPRELRDAIGMYANEAPLWSDPAGEDTFLAFLRSLQERARMLFALRGFPFTEVVARLGGDAAAREAGAQVGVTYLRLGHRNLSIPELRVRPLGVLSNRSSRRPVTLWMFDEPAGLRFRMEFDPGVMERHVAEGLIRGYRRLLEHVVDDPHLTHRRISFLSRGERSRLLGWGGTAPASVPAPSVSTLVEAQAKRSPDATAVEAAGGALSYAELDGRANHLARRLRAFGARPGTCVAVGLQRSPELVIALLGILKAGAAYVPLDPQYPEDRLKLMIDRARPHVVVSDCGTRPLLDTVRTPIVLVDDDQGITDEPAVAGVAEADPENLAYVIFTSGSTGVPKGVAMPHRALVNLLEWQRRRFRIPGPVRTLQYASPSFDVAFQEIFSTLATGGCLILVDEELRRDFERLARFIDDRRVQRLFVPFLALDAIAGAADTPPTEGLEVEVITSGERLEITPSIRKFFLRRSGWSLANQYGPTETHVVSEHRLGLDPAEWPSLPSIGRPVDGARLRVLDSEGQLVPVGVHGELHVGGACLARGYLHKAGLTAERFVEQPENAPESLLYRTGDLVRWRPDGELEFLGRIDDQLKIRGYRVEPGEIEARLVEHLAVSQAAVIARDAPGGRRLVAYVVGAGAAGLSHQLRTHLEVVLPAHMVPSAFVEVEALPLTTNGKLDRRRLPEPQWEGGEMGTYVAPRSPLERTVAEIWARILGLERVGAEDNFFRLGGHSLMAGEVVAEIRKRLDRDIPLGWLFANPTVAALAARLEHDDGAAGRPIARVPRRSLTDLVDATGSSGC